MSPEASPDLMSIPDVPEPVPLEPTLMALIVEVYDGARDEAGRYHTVDEQPGFAKFVGGCSYRGGFAGGVMHGHGKYTWSDGTIYDGDIKWNTIDGRGTFTWPGGSSYTGDLRLGLRHGQGTFTGPHGAPRYQGGWSKGRRHGVGTLWYDADQDSSYEGDWVDNRRHGQGRLRWKPIKRTAVLTAGPPRAARLKATLGSKGEGNLYEGSWVRDQKCGHGVMNWFDKRERYTGDWVADQQHGKGEHVWMEDRPDSNTPGVPKQMCNRYLGDWFEGERHGEGAFAFANGARYSGAWSSNAKQGFGVFTFEDGHVYAGLFDHDNMTGPDAESPLKGSDPTQQPQLRLHVEDLLNPETSGSSAPAPAGEVSPLAARLALERTLLRYNSELRHMYRHYAKQEHGCLPEAGGVFSLSLGQFAKLWKDCGFGARGVSLAAVHRLAQRMRTAHRSKIEVLALVHGKEGGKQSSASPLSSSPPAPPLSGGNGAGKGKRSPGLAGVMAKNMPPLPKVGSGGGGELSQQPSLNTEPAVAPVVVAAADPDDEGATYRWDSQPLLFREFAELLARIAVVAFCSPDDSANPALGLQGQAATPAAHTAGAAHSQGGGSGSRPGTGASSSGGAGTARSAMSGAGGGLAASQQLSARSTSAHSFTGSSLNGGGQALSKQGSAKAQALGSSGQRQQGNALRAHCPTPSEAFTLLMKVCVQGYHSKPLVKGTFEWSVTCDEDTKLVLASHASRLQAAFKRHTIKSGAGGGLGGPNSSNKSGGSGGHRMSLRGFLELLASAGANLPKAQGGLGLSSDAVLAVLVVGTEDASPLASDPTLLESELLWGEFVEALAHVANSARPADFAQPLPMPRADGLDDDAAGEADDKVALSTGWPHALQQPLHKHLEALLVRLDLEAAAAWASDEEGELGNGNEEEEEEEEEEEVVEAAALQQEQQLRLTGPETIDDDGSVGESSVGSLIGGDVLGGVGAFGVRKLTKAAPVLRAPRLPIVL